MGEHVGKGWGLAWEEDLDSEKQNCRQKAPVGGGKAAVIQKGAGEIEMETFETGLGEEKNKMC